MIIHVSKRIVRILQHLMTIAALALALQWLWKAASWDEMPEQDPG
jgi:hypothetical protein